MRIEITKIIDSENNEKKLIFETIADDIINIEYRNEHATDKDKRFVCVAINKKIAKEMLAALEHKTKYFACISRMNFVILELEKIDWWYELRFYDFTFVLFDRKIIGINIYLTQDEINDIVLFLKKALNEKEVKS